VNANIFLADTDTVIASNIDYVQNNKLKNDIRNNNKNIYLTDNYEIKNEYDIYNISPNGDLIGYLIVEYKKGKKDNIELIKFVLSFLEKYFEFE
jgi:hypothetical protein